MYYMNQLFVSISVTMCQSAAITANKVFGDQMKNNGIKSTKSCNQQYEKYSGQLKKKEVESIPFSIIEQNYDQMSNGLILQDMTDERLYISASVQNTYTLQILAIFCLSVDRYAH